MSEEKVVARTDFPLTAQSLAEKLRGFGMAEGQTVLVHMAMSKLNYVIGGAQAVIMAFLDVLGESGTLMMPAHTNYNTDPAEWQHPPVPESWWQPLRDNTPAYDPVTSPTYYMGVVPELFRVWPETVRSNHPVISFAARGANAEFLLDNHALEEDTGNRSPIGRLYEVDGYVLLLGVDHFNNTSLHLAEFRADYAGKKNIKTGCAMMVDGLRQWVEYECLNTYADDFGEIGDAFDAIHNQPLGKIADADVRLFKQRKIVDFAIDWMEKNRDLTKTTT